MNQRTELIEQRLTDALEPTRLEIVDDSAGHAGHAGVREHGGGHYRVLVVSQKFTNASTVKRHQMIYQALGSMMQHEIHALSIQAYSPDEIKQLNNSN